MTYASPERGLRGGVCALVCCAALFGQDAWAAGGGIVLAPHRAIYDLTLTASRGGSAVVSVVGRMAYDLVGSACEGYSQNMRFVTRMTHENGNSMLADLRSSTWEDGLGKRFRFDSSQFRDQKATEATAGDAARASATRDVKVELTKPARKNLSLPARVYFPVQHTIALIQAARAAKLSFRADLYDGSEKGDKVYDTVAALGLVRAPGSNRRLPEVASAGRLDGLSAWPISIAYFEPAADGQDAVPVYEISFLMFENGVSRRLHIDYGDFALRGDLTEITFHAPSKCERK